MNEYHLCWENQTDPVSSRTFINDSLGQVTILCDSINSDDSFSLNWDRIAYIDCGNLYMKTLIPDYDDYDTPILLDSGGCSSPVLFDDDYEQFASILYVKEIDGKKNIFFAEYHYHNSPQPTWLIQKISSGDNDISPRFGFDPEFVIYQTLISGFWKVQANGRFNSVSQNNICNYVNPFALTYPIITKNASGNFTPFFVVFDSDSIPGNNEIFWKALVLHESFPDIINLSNTEGGDRKPQVMVTSDSLIYLWEHESNGKTDIW
ncbi:MAG: hypothetical protein COT43_10165 [Candidatus Marinimicrobia bacterium CG08_land_8_20_14_0_20_45_22]|nr:MAG: hypothetical protein COT43_10165 [Candidatus Marinimicrobia bacterium CG08_land_8_20_14_0_20_45_22]